MQIGRWWPLAVVVAGGCSDGSTPSGPGPAAGFSVVSRAPAPERIDAPRDAVVAIEFDVPLDPAVAAMTPVPVRVLGRWAGLIPGALRLANGDRRLEFVPDRPFLAGDYVTVMVGAGVRSAEGTSLGRTLTWTFWAATAPGTLDLTLAGTVEVRNPGEGRVQAYGAYAGDLTGDGFPDLVVPNELSNDLRVFVNDGAGAYPGFTTYPIPATNRPSTNEGTDFDFDGHIDFAVGSAGANLVSVFDGGVGGVLSFGATYTADAGVRGLCVLDLDGDGALDIVTANRAGTGGGNIARFRNDGGGRFTPLGLQETGVMGETACATGDANEDGVTDVFIGGITSGEIVVMLGDGTGALSAGVRTSASGGPWMVVAGDVNGDGHVDVATANYAQNTVAILLGDGKGGLVFDGAYLVGDSPIAVDLGDLDGDGDLDLVASNYGGGSWTVLENVAGAFGNPRTLPTAGAGSCAVMSDRDGDGDLDLVGVDEVDDLLYLFRNGP